jgi:predicted dehydrogenase/threonine dehydrogenase-like Zn-dependent dehydrogenase
MLRSFASAGLVSKALRHPERVRQVAEKLRTEGVGATLGAVTARLDEPQPLGYCNAGVVVEAGPGVQLRPGDRVVSNGPHAEIVRVGKNLCAPIPPSVDDATASFAVLSAVALQGIRLSRASVGDRVLVLGLGLVGLLSVQILKAMGCRVFGADLVRGRLELARGWGAEVVDVAGEGDPVAIVADLTAGRGVDAVVIAAATSSAEPVSQAARMCRHRGRVILVGVADLRLDREEFYRKEITFQVSCSYGPGRYDPVYEDDGVDYPYGLVRWTEQRNLEAVLELMASGAIDTRPLVSREFDFAQAADAYRHFAENPSALGIVLRYPEAAETVSRVVAGVPIAPPASSVRSGAPSSARPSLGLVGAGQFARRVLLPAFHAAGARFRVACSTGGAEAALAARRFGFERAATDVAEVLADPEVAVVVVATRHGSHSDLVVRALDRGLHVFVEKPLAIDEEGIRAVEEAYARRSAPSTLMVGFNRRFSPHVVRMRELLADRTFPVSLVMVVNAGRAPREHWVHHPTSGGGRIVGEACHFIDLMRHLVGARIVAVAAAEIRRAEGSSTGDNASITLTFADGSVGALHYLSEGHRSVSKERLEVFGGGRVLALDDFRTLRGYGFRRFRRLKTWQQDKGHRAEVEAFLAGIRSGSDGPIPFAEIVEVARASLAARTAVATGEAVRLTS